MKEHAQYQPDKLAVADSITELTYKKYWRKITNGASFLKAKNIYQGEYILIKTSQTVAYMAVYHAIQLAGAVCIPIEKSTKIEKIIQVMQETKATKFIGDVTINGYECYQISELFEYECEFQDHEIPDINAEAIILYTTGTTGKSKGIVIKYSSEDKVAENVIHGVEMKKNNVELVPIPLNHSNGLRRYLANMVNGSTVVFADGLFFIKAFFDLVDKYKVTSFALVPASINIMFKLSGDKIKEYNEQLDYIQVSSAIIPEADKERLKELLPNVRLYNVYGSTEFGPSCILNFNSKDNRSMCIGYPARHAFFKIIDENGDDFAEATAENPGMLAYSGPMGMKEYYGAPELTAKAVVKGYLITSDLGYIDSQGRVYMLGRADDVIITGGNKVSPFEVEEVAKKTKGVIDCICAPKEDELAGAVPILYIVTDVTFDLKVLKVQLTNFLEEFKRPRSIIEIESVPRTYNGKLDRKAKIS